MKPIKILAALFLPVLAACEPATAKKPDQQPRETLTIPKAPEGASPFQLTDAQSTLVYQPQLLIWDPETTPAKIARVSEASVEGRKRKAERRAFLRGHLQPAAAKVEPARLAAQAVESEVEKVSSEQVKAALNEAFVNWFELRLAELGPGEGGSGLLTAEDVEAARANFGGYCEYKIWELATSPLLRNQFATRPTPLVMCEPYFAREDVKLLDKSTPACADAPAGEFKDYFACVWEEGVLKTKLFTGKITPAFCSGGAGRTRGDAVREWLASGTLRAALGNDTDVNGRTVAKTLTSAMLAHQPIPAAIAVAPHADLNSCRAAFAFRAPTAVASWTDASLGQLKGMVETKSLTGNEVLTLLPKAGEVAAQQTKFERLGTPLLVFGVRGEFSVNDTIFNQNYVGPVTVTVAPEVKNDFDASQDFGALDRAQEAARQSLPAELVAKRERATAELKATQAQVAELQATDAKLNQGVADITLEGIKAVSDEKATLTFIPFELQVTKNGAGLDVRARLKSGAFGVVGCAPVLAGAPCAVSPKPFDQQARPFTALSYDAANAELVLDVLLDDPKGFGLSQLPRTGNPIFNDIPESELIGRTLRLTIWPNRLNDTLNFITGKVEVLEAGEAKYLGSFSGDDFAMEP